MTTRIRASILRILMRKCCDRFRSVVLIRRRWASHVFTVAGVDRRYYELCALTELRNALRSGDIWVPGSRQFKDFEDYL